LVYVFLTINGTNLCFQVINKKQKDIFGDNGTGFRPGFQKKKLNSDKKMQRSLDQFLLKLDLKVGSNNTKSKRDKGKGRED
jgi:hypothetical protein